MSNKVIVLLITLASVCVNLVFAFTGVTSTVTCSLSNVAEHIQEVAHAAFNE